jgi:hypothetical protein
MTSLRRGAADVEVFFDVAMSTRLFVSLEACSYALRFPWPVPSRGTGSRRAAITCSGPQAGAGGLGVAGFECEIVDYTDTTVEFHP